VVAKPSEVYGGGYTVLGTLGEARACRDRMFKEKR